MQKGYERFEREISTYCDKNIINDALFSSYKHFEKNIHTYCDNSIGEDILFPAFVNLWDEDDHMAKKDLVVLASKIIADLLEKKILIRIFQRDYIDDEVFRDDEFGEYVEIPPKNGFENGYGLYKIQPHEDLIKYSNVIKRKMKLLRRTCN